ncbi:MAG TPA: DoxX family protein [Pirellulaceae bacterium]|nr:DoxX family protein [Pirellulaceae bacterium]HMO93908.1 DoxX family protein [Pirellulaceae bacterium]HMP68946.1 DoxX family protein [Pirellulaceae bacterium]
MQTLIFNLFSLLGRVFIATIFLMSAVGNKIPQFSSVISYMESKGVPFPSLMLAGAIVFLIAGSLSVIAGYQTRVGATLLLVFLILATYFFHNFWALEEAERQGEMIQFMKNLSMAGTMLFLIGNGGGGWSLDGCRKVASDRIPGASK